jgi:protocatechuate 3,4-dioxygenase beta subunit
MNFRLLLLACVAVAAATTASAPASTSACPTTNAPNALVLAGGSPQTGQIGKQFQDPFQVALANTNGCPLTGNLAGAVITFLAPGSGASGAFATTATNTATTGTNATGAATAPAFTANETAGTYTVLAVSDYGTVSFTVTNTAHGVAASIVGTSGGGQSTSVNARFGAPLVARVLDSTGQPVHGVTVTFVVTTGSSGASASFLGGNVQASVTTDADGVASSPPLLANALPGSFSASAGVDGVALPVVYDLANHAGAVTIVAKQTAQSAKVGARYAHPLVARVREESGRPVEGATVTFTLIAPQAGAGGTFPGGATQATALTDASGLATSPHIRANATAGRFEATASIPSGTVGFGLRNVAGAPAAVAAGGAGVQTAALHARLLVRFAVTVTDADGNAVSGAWVTFAAPSHGASGSFGSRRTVRVRTNARGIAVAPAFRTNRVAGGYAVRASVGGAGSVAFGVVNTR